MPVEEISGGKGSREILSWTLVKHEVISADFGVALPMDLFFFRNTSGEGGGMFRLSAFLEIVKPNNSEKETKVTTI